VFVFSGDPPTIFDLGNEAVGDPGQNFSAPTRLTVNTHGTICLNSNASVLAAGNLWGSIDCADGGTLLISPTCSGPVDVGGVAPDAGTTIDVSNCQ
jgi:hypothetical protein